MKKRTAFIGVILFLSTFPFLNDEVFGSSDFYQNYLAEFRPNPDYYKFKRMEKLFNEGLLESRTGDHQGAIETFSKFINKYSKNPSYVSPAYFNRGLSKNFLGDRKGACSDWQEALKLGHMTALFSISQYCE